MAANDEFPRGWTFGKQDVTPFTVLPAVAGISHVLDTLAIETIVTAALGGPFGVAVQVNGVQVGTLYSPAPADSTGSFLLSGSIIGALGAALIVSFAAPVGMDFTITAVGHDT